jgi:glutamyl-tRNA synthetase
VRSFLERAGWDVESNATYIKQVVGHAGDRIRVAGDIVDYAHFFSTDDSFEYDEKAFEKRLRKAEGAAELLTEFRGQLAAVEPFTSDELERLLKTFVDAKGIKIGQIVHALRVAVTGKAVGFGLFETLAILDRERCLARIDRALKL